MLSANMVAQKPAGRFNPLSLFGHPWLRSQLIDQSPANCYAQRADHGFCRHSVNNRSDYLLFKRRHTFSWMDRSLTHR